MSLDELRSFADDHINHCRRTRVMNIEGERSRRVLDGVRVFWDLGSHED